MDNGDLIRGLSSPIVQVFGIALTVLILALNAGNLWFARPIALVAAVVVLVIIANWVSHAITRSHVSRQHHEHHSPRN